MTVENSNFIRVLLFFGVLGAMFVCETLWPKRAWETPRAKRLGFHVGVSVLNTIILRVLVTAPLAMWLLYVEKNGWGLARWMGLGGVTEILATLVVCDALDYGWHRLNHSWPVLWRFHKAHHMDTHVDVTTALRFHIGELVLSGCAKVLWILLWGPSLIAFIIFEAAITAFAQFHHSNIDFPDSIQRTLREIIMTPRVHASHHTVSIRTRDSNFATIFSAWDRVFGSFREPDFKEMGLLGLKEGRSDYLSVMKFIKTPFISMALVVLAATSVCATGASDGTNRRALELTYQGEIRLPAGTRTADVWIPLAGSREGQKITERKIEISNPYRITQDPMYKNEMVYLRVQDAEGPIPFKIKYRALVDENLIKEETSQDSALYLKPARLMPADETVRIIARENLPKNGSVWEKAKAGFDYVIRHMQYDKETPGWGQGDTRRACLIGKGNCTDFHSLFISVAHAAEIPARFKIGFQVPTAPEGTITGYHCWAEFSDEKKKWNTVDASEAWKHPEERDRYFAKFDPNKFMISMGRDIELSPPQKGGPVNIFFYPYVEAEGTALTDAAKMEYSYKNLT